MKMNNKILFLVFAILGSFEYVKNHYLLYFFKIKSDSVCTESMLVTELIQDIKDNGKLDCLRKPLPAPTDRIESEMEKKYRLEAAWDTGR